ncbi:MAG: tRNA(fMet)-specific endonuclease VapC [Sphingomonadales bacterium]|nr:tRNA(fMet)-specific endonuclease VapC [Sphingomonadales bacterium]
MRYLLDTNCCIYLFTRDYPELNRRVKASPSGEIGLSSVTFAEIAHGSARGLAPPPDALDRLAIEMPVLPFDEAAARAYADLPFERGNFDRLLAAHAIAMGLVVITRNTRHFAAIPTLRTEDWTLP